MICHILSRWLRFRLTSRLLGPDLAIGALRRFDDPLGHELALVVLAGFDLPHDLEFLVGRLVLHGHERDEDALPAPVEGGLSVAR